MEQQSPQDIEALKEKLKSMSPEELKEFQKKHCIFCQIVSKKVSAKVVYEDAKSLAILDINPANPGHILLMLREHYTVMPQVPEEDLKGLFVTAKLLSNALLRALEVKGTNILVANGPAAGQKAQHFMIHVIPRSEGDGISFVIPQQELNQKQLDALAERLRERMGTREALASQKQVYVPQKKKEEAKPAAAEPPLDDKPVAGPPERQQEEKPEEGILEDTGQKKGGGNLDDIADFLAKNG
ncbi:TPA: HIT family protein [Candidatus Woesearchaeota archaeon]|nr:HIT family protein [Candidatus Woesearchaeota archaeon]HII69368.1 HIT family protein [Candidatus Woesearchaeota archaeon]